MDGRHPAERIFDGAVSTSTMELVSSPPQRTGGRTRIEMEDVWMKKQEDGVTDADGGAFCENTA